MPCLRARLRKQIKTHAVKVLKEAISGKACSITMSCLRETPASHVQHPLLLPQACRLMNASRRLRQRILICSVVAGGYEGAMAPSEVIEPFVLERAAPIDAETVLSITLP